MNKLPAKQIYLLMIIIIGIIALSVYSTYALFTFESSTSDIVSIHTPKTLQISENVYEYQQLVVEPDTITTTDIDIYNPYDYNVCYSVWYKIIGTNIDEDKVQIFEKSNDVLTSSGMLSESSNIRITIVIINDNDKQVKINLGTIGSKKETENCTLNLDDDKNVISTSYNNLDILSTKLLEEKDKSTEEEANYLTYKDEDEVITYKSTDKLYISEKFNYEDELFTLEEPENLTIAELIDKKHLDNKNIYFCKESDKCSILYKITELEKQESKTDETVDEDIYYDIKKYDKLVGYSKTTNGLRQVNEKDYVFYGDNPNNYVYYNCENSNDVSTCELWRIIGLFYNKETEKYNAKIIRNESIGKYQFDYKIIDDENKSSNSWLNSTLHKYLNEEYEFTNNYDMYLEEFKQEIERIPSLDYDVKNMKISNEYINSKVNLINLTDYLHTSSCEKNKISEYDEECFKNNWLNNIEVEREWTLTSKEIIVETEPPVVEETTEEESIVINYIYSVDKNITEIDVNEFLEVRPVVFLKSRILLLEGTGSFDNPYIIK